MKFFKVTPLHYDGHKSKYISGDEVIINLSSVSRITYYEWRDSKGDKHCYREFWFKGETYQDTIKISEGDYCELCESGLFR